MNNENGVWRTVRGRRIFIRNGESLGSAMSRSGKFKKLSREKRNETRTQISDEDRLNKSQRYWEKEQKASTKEKFKALRKKAESDYNKTRARNKDEIEYRGAEQAEKNRPNENAPLNENAKTRVERFKNRYSETDRRELRHEELQKKLRDYKNKKGLEDNLDRRSYEQKINDEYALNFGDSSQNYKDTKGVSFKRKEKAVMQQRIEDYKAKKQSNNKIENNDRVQNLAKMYDVDRKTAEKYQYFPKDIQNVKKYGEAGRYDENEWKQSNNKVESERKLYERAKNHPETIDPMTENSTDWEALEKKYGKQETIKNYVEKKKSNNAQTTNRILERSGKVNQKTLKSYADDGLAIDITRYSDKDIDKLEKKHGRLTHLKTSMGTYGMNGALLKSEKTGEYFVITSRNGNLFRLV